LRTAVLVGSFHVRYAHAFLAQQLSALPDPFVLAADEGRSDPCGGSADDHTPADAPVPVEVVGDRGVTFGRIDRRVVALCSARAAHRGETMGFGPDAAARQRLQTASVAYAMFMWNAQPFLRALRHPMTRDLPLIVHAGGSDVTQVRERAAANARRLDAVCDRASVVLCGSEFIRGCLVALGIDEDKVRVHYLGVPTAALASTSAAPPRGATRTHVEIVAVSRLVAVKGVDHTLRAFVRARTSGTPMRLRIAGDGDERAALEALAAELGVDDAVEFLGFIPRDEVFSLLRDADVFVQHNVRAPDGSEEALGGSILEASGCGLPVVATRSGGVREAVVDAETGFLVEAGDDDAMAGRILELAQHPDLRRTMGEAGRAFVRAHHDMDTQNAVLGRLVRAVGSAAS
jgi:glycosyltransferase involved in cell wall biosynthesis